jgi:hypothetical protein
MYIRFGISGSAFPATIHRLDTKTIDSASGLHIKHRKDRQVVRCALWDVTPWTRMVKFVPYVDVKKYGGMEVQPQCSLLQAVEGVDF